MTDEPITLNQCFDRYLRDVLPSKGARTQKDYARHIKVLRRVFGHRDPNDVQQRDIGRFLDVEKGKIQRNRQVAVFSAVYSKIVGRWYLARVNPCIGVERNESKRRDRYITNEEFDLIRARMPAVVQIAMDLALITGQRQGDLLALRWEHVAPNGISFRQSKTGKRLRVALSDELNKVLDRARKMKPDLPREYVLRTSKGRRYTSEGFRALWQRRMRKILKGYYRKPRGKERIWHDPVIKERLTFHDIRAKCVSDSATLDEAYERAGHSNMSMTRSVYDRAEREVKPLK